MSADALKQAVVQSTTTDAAGDAEGRFDVSSEVFEQFEARLEDLHWREADDGALLVADAARRPEVMVRVALEAGELVATAIDPADADWRRARVVSEPGAASNPQFD